MKKETLQTFIQKYSLSGLVENVKWDVDDTAKSLKTSALTDDSTLLIDVTVKNFDAIVDAKEIGVFGTVKLKQMLSVIGDDITVDVNKTSDGSKITSLTFTDKETDIQFVTADLAIIKKVPALKKQPVINLEIELSPEFISKFVKAKGALQDVDIFTLMMNKKNELEMILGYSSLNSNRIKLSVKTLNGLNTVSKRINFSAKYFKEILTANDECTTGVLRVSDGGMAIASFDSGDFVSTYNMFEIKSAD